MVRLFEFELDGEKLFLGKKTVRKKFLNGAAFEEGKLSCKLLNKQLLNYPQVRRRLLLLNLKITRFINLKMFVNIKKDVCPLMPLPLLRS